MVGSPSDYALYVDWLNWHVVQDVDVQAVSNGPMPWGRNYAGQRFYLPTKMIITLTNCGSLSGTHEVPWQECSGGWTYYWVTYPDDSYVACSYSYSDQVMGGAFLLAVGGAARAVHVQHDLTRPSVSMDPFDPCSRQPAEDIEVQHVGQARVAGDLCPHEPDLERAVKTDPERSARLLLPHRLTFLPRAETP